MRKSLFILVAAVMVGLAMPAVAELQNVQVGGSLRIRANWYNQVDAASGFFSVSTDDNNPDAFFIEQRTRLNVKADFTDDVTAFIELDSYNNWGDDNFRRLDAAESVALAESMSPGIAPSDITSDAGNTPVNLYQGYVEMRESWGYPITVRIGRSEMQHGSEFLVGNNDTSSAYSGLSFDGIWGTYTGDQFSVQAFWSRLAQNSSTRWEHAGDVDFMGFYGSYTGIEDMTIDGYYYYLHEAATSLNSLAEASGLHTVGARFAGNKSQFDWELNGAYQFGDSGLASPADSYSAFAVQGALGYTFDIEYQPRIFVTGAYYDGDDEDPAFRRLFSDHEYSEFLDAGDLSNVWVVGGGASAQVTEAIGLSAVVNYYQVVEDFGASDDDLGVEIGVYGTYAYSEDLLFSAGYAHLFVGDGLEAGAVVANSGRTAIGGSDDDIDYVFFETSISF